MAAANVLDIEGQRLSPCSRQKALRLLAAGKAKLISEDPFTIQLPYAVSLPPEPESVPQAKPGAGKSILLHICCGPCGTYTIKRLREQGFEVRGFWYNPNIHPFTEHERRRECVRVYAEDIDLPMMWSQGYEMPAYFRAVAGHEAFGERCAICYRLRLGRTAQVARQEGFDAFTTTLLISPYQQQALIRDIGEELARDQGVAFYFENFRQGWCERGHLARQHDMYQQRYCGCIYSEWEAKDRDASTLGRARGRRDTDGD
jgi:predicted adenine nucleotide alpha hydrolase (AANH) superfamily ATPase